MDEHEQLSKEQKMDPDWDQLPAEDHSSLPPALSFLQDYIGHLPAIGNQFRIMDAEVKNK